MIGSVKEKADILFPVFSDIMFNPAIENEILGQEREIVLREIAKYKGSPRYGDNKRFLEAFFGDIPLNNDIFGSEEKIRKATPESLLNFHSRGYSPNNMYMILVGSLSDKVENSIREYFGNQPPGQDIKYEFPVLGPLKRKTVIHSLATDLKNKDKPEESSSELRIGFIVPHEGHKDFISTYMLSTILGSGQNSRLFKEIREKRGLSYGINSIYNGVKNAGFILIEGDVKSRRQEEAIDTVFNEIKKLQAEPVGEKDLEVTKFDVIYAVGVHQERNSNIASDIDGMLRHGKTPENIIEEVKKITPEKIMEAAKYLPKNRDEPYVMLLRDPLKEDG
jgi:zinc protease